MGKNLHLHKMGLSRKIYENRNASLEYDTSPRLRVNGCFQILNMHRVGDLKTWMRFLPKACRSVGSEAKRSWQKGKKADRMQMTEEINPTDSAVS